MQLLTPKDVAARLAVSPRTVYSWIAEGRLPAVRLSERVTRVPEEAVDALVRTAMRPATASAPLSAQQLADQPTEQGAGQPLIAAESSTAYGSAVMDLSATMMDRIQAARAEILAAAAEDRLENVRVFGSIVRGDATAESDVDLLVDPLPGCTLFNLTGFRMAVEELLGASVDVTPARSMKSGIAEGVLAEAKPL